MNRAVLVCCALVVFLATQSVHAASATELIPPSAPAGAGLVVVGTGLDGAGIAVSFLTARGRVEADILERAPALLRVVVPADALTGQAVVSDAGAAVATFNFSRSPVPRGTRASSPSPRRSTPRSNRRSRSRAPSTP